MKSYHFIKVIFIPKDSLIRDNRAFSVGVILSIKRDFKAQIIAYQDN